MRVAIVATVLVHAAIVLPGDAFPEPGSPGEVPAASEAAPLAPTSPPEMARDLARIWEAGVETEQIRLCTGFDRSWEDEVNGFAVFAERASKALATSDTYSAWVELNGMKYTLGMVKDGSGCVGGGQIPEPAVQPALAADLLGRLDALLAAIEPDLIPPEYDFPPLSDLKLESGPLILELHRAFESRFDGENSGREKQRELLSELRPLVYLALRAPYGVGGAEPLSSLVKKLEHTHALPEAKKAWLLLLARLVIAVEGYEASFSQC